MKSFCKLDFSASYNIVAANLPIILIISNDLLQFERFCLAEVTKDLVITLS